MEMKSEFSLQVFILIKGIRFWRTILRDEYEVLTVWFPFPVSGGRDRKVQTARDEPGLRELRQRGRFHGQPPVSADPSASPGDPVDDGGPVPWLEIGISSSIDATVLSRCRGTRRRRWLDDSKNDHRRLERHQRRPGRRAVHW